MSLVDAAGNYVKGIVPSSFFNLGGWNYRTSGSKAERHRPRHASVRSWRRAAHRADARPEPPACPFCRPAASRRDRRRCSSSPCSSFCGHGGAAGRRGERACSAARLRRSSLRTCSSRWASTSRLSSGTSTGWAGVDRRSRELRRRVTRRGRALPIWDQIKGKLVELVSSSPRSSTLLMIPLSLAPRRARGDARAARPTDHGISIDLARA